MRQATITAVALFLALSVSPALAEPASNDTPSKTPSGATFTLPKSWALTSKPGEVVAIPPEPDTHVALVEIDGAAGAKDAATKAWAIYGPERAHPFKLLTPSAAHNGWDEQADVEYETSANEKLIQEASVFRRGTHWVVLIIDAAQATAEKRGAAIGLIARTLRPAGYSRESFAGRVAHRLDADRVAQIRQFVQSSIQELGVPGASFAVIEHGKLVFEGGVGVRELGKPEPVDAHTLFMIASNTKGMSTLLLAKQVDAGRVGWDQPVIQVYPSFRLGSDATTRKVLIRHLVCACTGLPRKDLDWIFATTPATPASTTFTQLAATEPTSGFGEV